LMGHPRRTIGRVTTGAAAARGRRVGSRVFGLLVLLAIAWSLTACSIGSQESASPDHPRFGPLPSTRTTGQPDPDTSSAPTGSSAAQPPGKPGYRLVFADEFDGTEVDSSTWAKLTPWKTKSTTGESQYYDPANTFVRDGNLVIKSEERPVKGRKYASGILTSLNRPKFQYGYYEIRSKSPKGQGIWPAFWLTNDSTSEIDILEMLGSDPRRLHSTLHHTVGSDDTHQHRSETIVPDLSQDFHILAVDWRPEHVIWYMDGVEVWRYTADHIPADPMWMVVNTAVGGQWSGKPDKTTVFPQEFLVDYIRVYQRD